MKVYEYVRNKDVFELLLKLELKFNVHSQRQYRTFSFTIETNSYKNEYSDPNIILELNCEKSSQYKLFQGFNRIDFTLYNREGFSEEQKKEKLEQLVYFVEKRMLPDSLFDRSEGGVLPSQYYGYHIDDTKTQSCILVGDSRRDETQLTFSIRPEEKRKFWKDNFSSFRDYFDAIILTIYHFIESQGDTNE